MLSQSYIYSSWFKKLWLCKTDSLFLGNKEEFLQEKGTHTLLIPALLFDG